MSRYLSLRLILVGVLLCQIGLPVWGQECPPNCPCITPSTYVYCTDCPGPTFHCWMSSSSYTIYGTRIETWCNFGTGFCEWWSCETVSSISTSEDCNGVIGATQGTMCCSLP